MYSMRSLILQRRKSSAYLDFEDDNKFEDDPNGNIPQYAALSHGWGDETEMMGSQEIGYPGFSQLEACDMESSAKSSAILWTDRNWTFKNELVMALGTMLDTVRSRDNIVLLHGLGGAGKTRISHDYYAQRGENYDRIFWLSNQTHGSLQLEVRSSLLNALPQMSESMAAPRPPLWVDAICSNQADDEEKAVHVPLMGEIYENVKRILVWLGDAADDSDLAMDSFGQISEEVADGVLCKGYKSNFLCSPTSFSLAKVICPLKGVRQRCYGFIPEAHNPLVVKATNLLIGDKGIGPQAGPPSMGREDDDDDDCVGFHKFSRLNQSSGVVEKGAQLQARINICNLHKHSRCATIPKYGPPKRDPVAAAMSRPIRQSLGASTLNTWRDVISWTCGEGAILYSAKAKVWHGNSWQSVVVGL